MNNNFADLKNLYDTNDFIGLINDPNGIYWLKLRSVSRSTQLRELCNFAEINCESVPYRQLMEFVYDSKPDEELIDKYINEIFDYDRNARKENENYLISQLYQMKVFDWGGLYQNSLEQTIVNNYVKIIQNWEELNNAIENEILTSMQGYVRCSWYNHWTSIIIEDIFKDHELVIPAVGLVKKVDFFINNYPFDLKVTYFPDGYMKELRRNEGLRPEFTKLKIFCRENDIWFDRSKNESALFPELLAKISENPSTLAKEFIVDFNEVRRRLITRTMNNPSDLIIWLYENQGIRRFDAASRFFLILVDLNNLEDSWKLKRNKDLLITSINSHLSNMKNMNYKELSLKFNWQDREYDTYSDILFLIVNN